MRIASTGSFLPVLAAGLLLVAPSAAAGQQEATAEGEPAVHAPAAAPGDRHGGKTRSPLGVHHGDTRLPGPAVTLEQLTEIARRRSPRLAAARAGAEAEASRTSRAGLLPDPSLQLGFMNLSLPGFSADMASSMAPAVSVSQRLPFPGKLAAESRIADRSAEMARAGVGEAWWRLRARVAGAFYELWEVERRLELLRETREHLDDFRTAALALYRGGGGRQTDVLQAQVEVARTEASIGRVEASREAAAARLNALLDRPADTEIPPAELGRLPAAWPDRGELRRWASSHRPELERSRLGVRRAEARTERAGREIWPDLRLGAGYGQRGTATGTERMVSFTVGFDVPVFAGRRQLRQRDEARARAQSARAELAEARAEVDARLGELLAELGRTRTLLELYRTEVLPQARTTVESAFSSYRAGAVDFRTLVNARTTLNRYEDEFHELVADHGRALAELEATVGRELPADRPLETETR